MVWYANANDDEPESFISFEPVYNSCQHNNDHNDYFHTNPNFVFDFEVIYYREDLDFSNFESRTICQTHEFDRYWLIGGDEDHIQATVYHILDMIDVPSYSNIVRILTLEILDLKKRDAISALPKVERIEVTLNVIVLSFPGDDVPRDYDDVRLAVAPACKEAVVKHLETVVVETEDHCVICMDKIRVGSNVAVGRMPCMHMFHRTCAEKWLRNSGICPLCRVVFPS